MKRILLVMLIIFLALITFSCQKTQNNYEIISYGDSFVEFKELKYSDKVINAQEKWVDTLTGIIGNEYFTHLAKNAMVYLSEQVFLDAKVSEENALSFLDNFQNVLNEIKAIEDEKDELWRNFKESSWSDDDKIKYNEDLKVIQKKYSSDKMKRLYKELVTVNINSMGAEIFGKLSFLSLKQMFSVILDDSLQILIPDIYYIINKKRGELSALSSALEKVGEENLTTMLKVFATVEYFIAEKGAKNTVIYNVLRPNDLKWLVDISAENIKKLAITKADWQEIAGAISTYIDKIPIFNEDIKPFINNEIISYLGDNMYSICQNAAQNLKNADYNLLPMLSKNVSKDDNIEKFKQKAAYIRFISNENSHYFDEVLIGLFALTESKLINMNVTVPENFYEGIENKTLEEKKQSLNAVLEINLENINSQTLAEYENIFNAFEKTAAGYYKKISPRTYYYFKNTLGIILL